MQTTSTAPFNAAIAANVMETSISKRLNQDQAPTQVHPPANGAIKDATETMINLAWGMADLDDCVCRIAAHRFQRPNLDNLLDFCGGTFTQGTVASVGMQIVDRMQQMHVSGVVHGDVNPSNFCIGPTLWDGTDESSAVFLVDRGTARCIGSPEHEGDPVENMMFMSIAAHMGRPIGPWDELQSVFFMLSYFLVGQLPWQNLNSPSKQLKMTEACTMKEFTSLVDLGVGNVKGLPEFHEYILSRPTEMPDYSFLRTQLNEVLKQVGELHSGVFDWERSESQD